MSNGTLKIGSESPDRIYIGAEEVDKIYQGQDLIWTKPPIYGWHVDPTISDSYQAVTYLADARGKAPAAMGATEFSYGGWEKAFFMPRPCMLRYDGTVAYYLDPDDYTKKADGTASDVADAAFDGNAMMEWPLIWYKFEAGEAEGEGSFYCSDRQVDESYHCWCNINANNEIIPHFYTAIYDFTIQNGKARSLSGIALTSANGSGNTLIQTEANAVLACNTSSDVEWYFGTWSDRVLVAALLILMSKSLNDSAVFGKGTSITSSYVSGTLNNKGLFWGNTSDGALGVKIFGMENWWGSRFKRIAGLIGAGYGKSYMYKLTYGKADGSTAAGYNMTGSGYLTAFDQPKVYYDYVTKMRFGKHGMLPSAVGGSDSTYYAEYYDSGNRGDGCALFGGTGSLYLYMGGPNGNSDWVSESYTGSLSCKPVR